MKTMKTLTTAFVVGLAVAGLFVAEGFAANIGIDDASTGYGSGWVTGSGPTGVDEPFGTWTVTTENGGVADISGGRFHIESNSSAGGAHRVTADRSFQGGDLASGQTFSFDWSYRWSSPEDNYLRLMDAGTEVISLINVNTTSPTADASEFRVQTPQGVNQLIFADDSGSVSQFKDFSVNVELGAGGNAGQARVTTTGRVDFDSTWFAYTGSPDSFELRNRPANANAYYDAYYDNFEVIPEPASAGLMVLVGGLVWFVRRKIRA